MVPNLIWVPDFFGSQEIWALRNLGPKKLRPEKFGHFMKKLCDLSCGNHISRDQTFFGPKFLGTQTSWGPKKSGANMRSNEKAINVAGTDFSIYLLGKQYIREL